MATLEEQVSAASQRNDEWRDALRKTSQQTPKAYYDLREISQRQELDKMNGRIRDRDIMESAIAVTPPGGHLDKGMLNYINSSRGIEPSQNGYQDGQLMDGGWNPKTGGYRFFVARGGRNGGRPMVVPREIPQKEVYGMLKGNPNMDSFGIADQIGADIQRRDSAYRVDGALDGLVRLYADGRNKQMAERDRMMYDIDAIRSGYGMARGGGRMSYEQQAELIRERQNAKENSKLEQQKMYESALENDNRQVEAFSKNAMKARKVGPVEIPFTADDEIAANKKIASYKEELRKSRARRFPQFESDDGQATERKDDNRRDGLSEIEDGGKKYKVRTLKDGRKFRALSDSDLNNRSSWTEIK